MKAADYEGPRSIKRQERPNLSAEAGEVITKIKYCVICGTDLHVYRHGILGEPIGV
jgi:L-iditol 2-dehydrogenase